MMGQYPDSGVRPDLLSAVLGMGVIAHYAEGACYPVGGSGAIPRKLGVVVRAAGGCCFAQVETARVRVTFGFGLGLGLGLGKVCTLGLGLAFGLG